MLFDLNKLTKNQYSKQYDVCICGAGPAGITVARTLAAKGMRVALFEGGGLEFSEASQKLYEGKSVGNNDWDAVKNCRLRFFGGTSNHWSGMCGFFDEVDFEKQNNHLPGWPIARAEVLQYFDAAKEILDLPKDAFVAKAHWLGLNFKYYITSMSSPTRFNTKYLTELKNAQSIDLYINANLSNVRLTDDLTTVKHLELSNHNLEKFNFSAKQHVFAMGALENARMLLACNSQLKTGLGNQNDMVGRCFMEHLNIGYGRFAVDDIALWQNGIISLNPSRQLITKAKISNGTITFNPSIKTKSYGRTAALKQMLRNLVCKSESATDLSRRLVDFNCDGDGYVTSMIEQSPNLESRVTLDEVHDKFGIPKVILNWQLNILDMHTIRIMGLEAAKEMARLGVARVQLADFILDKNKPITEIGNHCHQMGTTRMSKDPKYGVVNENLKVHGINNLYIAGSSVFATGGGCNPTFTLTMLALRLGNYIAAL